MKGQIRNRLLILLIKPSNTLCFQHILPLALEVQSSMRGGKVVMRAVQYKKLHNYRKHLFSDVLIILLVNLFS